MKIETKIDDVACIGIEIHPGQGGPANISMRFGFSAEGVKCGEVSYPLHAPLDEDIGELVEQLVHAVETMFVKRWGKENQADERSEIIGLVKEF